MVADRQPDLDNASVGILLHMFLSFVQTAAHICPAVFLMVDPPLSRSCARRR